MERRPRAMPCEVSAEVREFDTDPPTDRVGDCAARNTPSWACACTRRWALASTPGLSRTARSSSEFRVASLNTVHHVAGRRALSAAPWAWRQACDWAVTGSLKLLPTVVQPATARAASTRALRANKRLLK